jgi:hypothetical protein
MGDSGTRCNMDNMCPSEYADIIPDTGKPNCPVDVCFTNYKTKGKDGKVYTLDCSKNEGCPNGSPKKELTYIDIANKVCPGTYGWQFDDLSSTYTCGSDPRTQYTIRFGSREPDNTLVNDGVMHTKEDMSDKMRTITFQNTLNEPVWLSVIAKSRMSLNVAWSIPEIMDGYKIDPNHQVIFDQLPHDWYSVKINPRLGCKQGGDGKWICETGDCGSAVNNWSRECKNSKNVCCWSGNTKTGNIYVDPTGGSLSSGIEMTFDYDRGIDYYDVSYLDAIDIPVFISTNGREEDCATCSKDSIHSPYNCKNVGCAFDTGMSWCPEAYRHISGSRVTCVSPCQIVSDQGLLWELYRKYLDKKNKGLLYKTKDDSVEKFVDFLNLVEIPTGGATSPATANYIHKNCNDDSECSWQEKVPDASQPSGYKSIDKSGRCMYSYEKGKNPVKKCVPFAGCITSDECKKRGKELGVSNMCGVDMCDSTMLVPKDALENEFGRSKIKSQLCCSCGCSTELTDVFPSSDSEHSFLKFGTPEGKKLMGCGDTCCDDGCYHGCTPNNWTKVAPKCDGKDGTLCLNYPQQSCDVKNKKLWPTFNNFLNDA